METETNWPTTDEEQQALLWSAVVKMAPAAGPAWTPRWLLDLADDAGELPAEPPWTTD